MEERLQKILAQAGHGSRRACETLIAQGRVRVNGQVAQLGQKADPARDTITLDGEPLAAPETLTYLLLNKPRGVVASREPQGERKTVIELVPSRVRLYPVGRLDLESEGLILLTNDGDLANRLTHPRYEVEKEYRVLVSGRGEVDEERLDTWRRGVVVENRETGERYRSLPADVRRETSGGAGTWLRVVMREGRKHEIRDIARTLGLAVERLIRVRLGPLSLGALKPGEWRALTPAEVRTLKKEPGPTSQKRSARTKGKRRPSGPAARARRPAR